MSKDLIVISEKEENIKRLKTISTLAGYNLFVGNELQDAVKMIERFLPLAIIIVDEDEAKTEVYIKEIKRQLPLIPIIIMLETKDHQKRERYLLSGIYDVIEQPWTEIALSTTLHSLEIKAIQNKEFSNQIKKSSYKNILSLILIIIPILLILLLLSKLLYLEKQKEEKKKEKDISVPSVNISGFFQKDGFLYLYDWAIQSFYVIDYQRSTLESTKYFFTPYIITSIKDTGANSFFAITDTNEIKRFSKDEKLTQLSSIRYDNVKDLCFDGMYIWIVEDGFISKALDNDKLTIVERFSLPQNLSKTEHLICTKDKLLYYISPYLFIADAEKPNVVKRDMKFPYKVNALNIINNKILFITPSHNKSYIKEIAID